MVAGLLVVSTKFNSLPVKPVRMNFFLRLYCSVQNKLKRIMSVLLCYTYDEIWITHKKKV